MEWLPDSNFIGSNMDNAPAARLRLRSIRAGFASNRAALSRSADEIGSRMASRRDWARCREYWPNGRRWRPAWAPNSSAPGYRDAKGAATIAAPAQFQQFAPHTSRRLGRQSGPQFPNYA